MLRVAFLVAAAALAMSGCRCGSGPVTPKTGEISIVYVTEGVTMVSTNGGTYDFGTVPMGKKQPGKLVVKNTGAGALFLETIEQTEGDPVQLPTATPVANAVFILAFERKELGVGETAEFPLAFDSPTVAAATVPHQSKVLLRASNTETGKATSAITFKGVSVSGECELPSTLDFGAVSRGDSFSLSVKIKNTRPIDGLAFVGEVTSTSGDDKGFTFTPESPKGEVGLKPGQEKTVTLTFAPTEIKDYLASVTMRRLDGCPDKIVKLVGSGVDSVLTWGPACSLPIDCSTGFVCTAGVCAAEPINFGYVTPTLLVSKQLTFSNQSLKDVTLTQLKPDKTDYKVVVVEPLLVPAATRGAGGTLVPGLAKAGVTFKPTLLGPRPGVINFSTTLPRQPAGVAVVKGYGGGPDIDVKPATINFGRVAYFSAASPPSYVNRKMTIQNVGTRPTPPDPKANLHLGELGVGAVYWEVRVKAGVAGNLATIGELCVGEVIAGVCTNKPSANAYDPALGIEASGIKALLDVPIRITPTSTGLKEWDVIIHSNDPDEPDFTVTIHADAIVMPPCNYAVSPATLNFGLVTPPEYRDLSFTITNRGTGATDLCLISNLDLKPGSSPLFSLPGGPLIDKELQPGASLIVPVRLWAQGTVPTTLNNVTGIASFSISDPVNPEGNVSLSGTISASCLTISPHDLNFGTVQKDCNSATRTFTIYNTCTTGVVINSYSMISPAGEPAGGPNCPGAAACPEFIPVSTAGIAPNATIASGAAPVTFSMKYHPINYGPDTGAFLIRVTQNSQLVDYVITLAGTGDTMGLNTDVFKQDSKPKADILLVIDNSCSMTDKQLNLSTNFASFIKYAISAQVDYQIGVTSTDMSAEGGRIVGDLANPRILTPLTPDVENEFNRRVKLGIMGSGNEEMLAPAVAALTAPIITAENAGLLRADAILAVVVITDADDHSALPVSYYVNRLLNIKGSQRASQFSFNAVGPYLPSAPAGGTCSYDGPGGGQRLVEAVDSTAGVKEEICSPDWSKALEQIGKNAFGYRTNFFLNATPDLTAGKTLVVKIDGLQVDPVDIHGGQVWTYDAANNSVNFEPIFVPEPGKTMTVTYFVACIP